MIFSIFSFFLLPQVPGFQILSEIYKAYINRKLFNVSFRAMESYEDFIRRHYHTGDDEDDEDEPQTPVSPSSVIVFRGARVLPPLLNEQQRDEMRRLRETAVSLMKRRREEESRFTDVSVRRHTDRSDDITDCDITSPAPLTSTAHDGRSTNQLRASPDDGSLENTQVTVLFEGHELRSPGPSATMTSSGYVTNDNTALSGRLDATRSGSDIISHAPVDGALLEEEEEEEEEVSAPLLKPGSAPSEPHRPSLQNLLKQSQEYRRRQRLLRSQARAAEEHSLSDKENEELQPKQTRRKEQDSKQRFSSVPAPRFCLSPVRCKKRGKLPGPLRRGPAKPALTGRRDNGPLMSSQTEQIAQLELNLSSLKALISDLETTLTLSQAAEGEPKPSSGSSYDVDVPSDLWKQLTPEAGGHEVTPRVKRRLLMNEDEAGLSSAPRGLQSSAQTQEDQVTALMEEERRRQEEALQSLCLLTAVVRGFLTRRLLHTERVSGLVRIITDSRVFLGSFQSQAVSSRQEVSLQERVTLQLRAARCELHQIFFSCSCSERMKMIRCDRELSRERRRSHDNKVKGSLSAATRKSLERKKVMFQRKRFSPSSEEKWNPVPKIYRVSKTTAFRGAR
ncbi:centriolar coiled-coil protein of 110 kDa isoform X2 [Puntigrus tetrazona]|uniref:centriolar coiled-coil protein of 110 kDa isoform X2 n=1 Tax=Puntigrus tetrazona TaxID=1606681 RepID=UPI001C894BF7|nr:centriolar coiled-coil protein of 110 kDa isoform X2 [Puntigrus tetrazona]